MEQLFVDGTQKPNPRLLVYDVLKPNLWLLGYASSCCNVCNVSVDSQNLKNGTETPQIELLVGAQLAVKILVIPQVEFCLYDGIFQSRKYQHYLTF